MSGERNLGQEDDLQSPKIKVLIIDDSAVIRNIVSHIIESSPRLEIWDKAINGRYALEKIQRALCSRENPHTPDIIVSDLEMPEMDGIAFLKKKKEEGINIPVVILSSFISSRASMTMEALSLGACDFVQKPTGSSHEMKNIAKQLNFLLEKYGEAYLASSRVHKNLKKGFTLGVGQQAKEVKKGSQRMPKRSIGVIAIGVSTGGPYALRQVLQALPANFSIPILIVQHMPVGFTEEFSKSLNKICPLEVKQANHGDIVTAGHVYVAPGGKHMVVKQKSLACVISITDEPPQNSHKPSAGKLFQSVAKVYGNRSLAIIMTGMGHDGSDEIGEIYKAGGVTIGQDEASSVVYGMPKIAEQKGFLDYILNLEQIAPKIIELVDYSLYE